MDCLFNWRPGNTDFLAFGGLLKTCFIFLAKNLELSIFFLFFPQAMWLCKQLDAVRVSPETLLLEELLELTKEVRAYKERKQVCRRR